MARTTTTQGVTPTQRDRMKVYDITARHGLSADAEREILALLDDVEGRFVAAAELADKIVERLTTHLVDEVRELRAARDAHDADYAKGLADGFASAKGHRHEFDARYVGPKA